MQQSRPQPQRLSQLRFAKRQAYLEGLSQAHPRNASTQRVARPSSHPLHKLALSNVQQLNRRRGIWTDQRQKQYDQRDCAQAKYCKQIRFADPCKVAALELEAQADYDRRMVVIRRFNFGPTDVVGGSPLADSAMQHSAYAASVGIQITSPELAQSEQQQQPELAFVIATAPWPPGATVRSTPRRPGAPSFALRLNH